MIFSATQFPWFHLAAFLPHSLSQIIEEYEEKAVDDGDERAETKRPRIINHVFSS